MKRIVICFAIISFFLGSCYRAKLEELHPAVVGCDTVNVSYSKTIAPIMNKYCVSCHSGPSPKGGISLDNYAGFAKPVKNGSLVGAINFDPNYVAMPEGATQKIDSCYINQIEAWVNAGAPNN